MHDDKRNYYYRQNNNSGSGRANATPQQNRESAQPGRNAGNYTRQNGSAASQRSSSGQNPARGNTPQMQARRTIKANGTQTTARRQTTSRQTSARQNTAVPRTSAMQPAGTASVSAAGNQSGGTLAWLKKTFAVDRTVLEKRDLVREQGSIDYVFLVLVLILLAFGTIMVYSASYVYSKNKYDDSYYIIFRQFIFIVVGFIGMGFATWFKPEWYKRFSVPFYIVCFFLLCLVPIIGVERNGAKRWLDLGFTDIQPSEFMKLGLVLMLAWFCDRYYERATDKSNLMRSSFFGTFVPLVITGIACLLVVIEKHLSGTIIMFMIGIIIIFASGTPLRLLIGMGAAGVVVLGIFSLVTPYTKRRIDIWLHPENDPQGAGYQTLQGLYAIGSGGLFGEGLGESYQKHMFVSQPQNDFIFTIVCEELGFIGALAVILLFVLFAWRGFIIAMKAPDTYSSLVVIGIVGKVVLQALLNIAVVTNSIPNTGISLPFFSYGGSSLCVLMVEMGIVLSISRFSKQQK
ncbi:MAG: putative lipid II flippase FtsW [Clostridia bacterium]|nr:putative lipid II flippase FtsW [Clostridia bacterium]